MLQEKGCYPLHVAARAGQSSQAELLIGADPGALDAKGNTPAFYARYLMSNFPLMYIFLRFNKLLVSRAVIQWFIPIRPLKIVIS